MQDGTRTRLARLTTLAVVPLGLAGCRCLCCPDLPPGEPVVQGTLRVDPDVQQATLELQIGEIPWYPSDAKGQVDLWVGPDPDVFTGFFYSDPKDQLIFVPNEFAQTGLIEGLGAETESFGFECLPATNPRRTRVWSYEGDVDDLFVIARVTRHGPDGSLVNPLYFRKYFEVPEHDHSWSFTGSLVIVPQGPWLQAKIGGEIGNDDAPLVGVVYDLVYGQERFTFNNGELQAPTHGWRPKRVWVWRLQSQDPPAWTYRGMHVDDAFWSTDRVPPLPSSFPTAGNPVKTENLVGQTGERYWFYAIVEEMKDGTTRYHAHRSAVSVECKAGVETYLPMVMSPDEETTDTGPVGS